MTNVYEDALIYPSVLVSFDLYTIVIILKDELIHQYQLLLLLFIINDSIYTYEAM